MTDPFIEGAGSPVVAHPVGKTRNPWGVWGLGIITCGIYYLYWWYKINEEVKSYDTQVQVEPLLAVGALFVPICDLVTIVRTGQRISQAQETGGAVARCSGWVGLLLALLLGLNTVYYQTALNALWAGGGQVPYGDPLADPGSATA